MVDNSKTISVEKYQIKGKKIYCRVWSNANEPIVLAKKKVKYGSPTFDAKVGGKSRTYKINYDHVGCIKQEGKKFYYDTVFDNMTGALSFHEFPEDLDSEEAYTVFKNNAVNMYVKKGGIPLIYLAIAMIAVIAMAFAMLFTVPAGLDAQNNVEDLDKQVTQERQKNAILQAEINQLRGQLGQ